MNPLAGIRILDLTRLLPGAVATSMLRQLGAEVIKVEEPTHGDYARWMPPLQDGLGIFFRSGNRGKKSLALDLKSADGQAVLQRLAQGADVLIEGFRPGVATRLGADYETLRQINPQLVYCSLSGWGQTGPQAHVSGHDLNYIAQAGPLGAELHQHAPSSQVADIGGAYVAVMGILAALFQCARTDAGDYIDVSMAESAMPFAMTAWVDALSPQNDAPFYSLRGESACYHVYRSRDNQPLALAALEPKFWANFCDAVGKSDWIPLQGQRSSQPELISAVSDLFKTRSAAEWDSLLADADCCFTRVLSPAELLDSPQIQARHMLGIDADGIPWMRSPLRLGAQVDMGAAPLLGEHSRQLLTEAGYTATEIGKLLAAGVIRQAE